MEVKEREERRKRNCIIKGVKKEKGDWRWGVEKILREIDAEVKVEEMRRIYVGGEERGDMVWVKLEKEDDKRRLWSKKKILKGKRIWIEEDLTRREREVRRRLGWMANEERKKGKSAWVEGDRIRLGEEWWFWDEVNSELKKSRQGRRGERNAVVEASGERNMMEKESGKRN